MLVEILKSMQRIYRDEQVVRILTCKGTERKLAPPPDLHPMEAPYRRSIAILRPDRAIQVEDAWEHWENLPQSRLTCKFVPCFLNITVFAANPAIGEHSSQEFSQQCRWANLRPRIDHACSFHRCQRNRSQLKMPCLRT